MMEMLLDLETANTVLTGAFKYSGDYFLLARDMQSGRKFAKSLRYRLLIGVISDVDN